MTILLILCILQIVNLVGWLWGLAWVQGIRTDSEMALPPTPGAVMHGPSLSIVIAAHNEQDRIEPCLRRLLAQNYSNLSIVVVNDRSDDRTRERVLGIMAQDSRVSLIDIQELPPGWTGKTHALARATASIKCDYLLFTDCDCRMVPGALAAVMHKVTQEKIDFVSLWPRLELKSWSEKLIAPAAAWLLGVWGLARSAKANGNSQIELGNGQFLLFSREAYERVGGHASVHCELAEDLILARKVADMGLRRWIGMGKGLYLTSRDNTFSQTCNSLTRVMIGSLVDRWRIALSVHILLGGVCSPILFIPMGIIVGITLGSMIGWIHVLLCITQLAVMQYVIRRLFSMTIEDPPPLWSFMAGGVICVGIVIDAWFVISGLGHLHWGKTAYRVRGSQIVNVISTARPNPVHEL